MFHNKPSRGSVAGEQITQFGAGNFQDGAAQIAREKDSIVTMLRIRAKYESVTAFEACYQPVSQQEPRSTVVIRRGVPMPIGTIRI
jgi:hypothetical protein